MFLYWLATIALQITFTFSLDCYACSNVSSTDQCHTTVLCPDNERCFAKTSFNGNRTTYTLGCQSNSECLQLVSTVSSVSIVGRSLEQTHCSQCCENDGCNKKICSAVNNQCADDPNFDCTSLNSVYDVCKDIAHARLMCPLFCGLCDFVNDPWSNWSNWGTCDVTCGTGQMIRTRTCITSGLGHGGRDCLGDSAEYKDCHLEKCPTHGQWSLWSSWNQCSVTCGVGVQRRYRSCNNPVPSSDGNPCVGDNFDYQVCFEKACIDGGWSEWLQWSTCSSSCKAGIKTRSRLCDNPNPSLLGRHCVGKDHEVELCSTSCGEPFDCHDILKWGIDRRSGIYTVRPRSKLIQVYCDMDTDGGGWTVFQHRFNGSVDFYRNFSDYQYGFGDLHGEFWLGLSYVKEMASHGQTELRLDLQAADGTTAYETFQNFFLSGDQYTLHIGQSAGTADDTGTGLTYHNEHPFSTYDRDNSHNCAVKDHGGWWYGNCATVNLNGNYVTPGTTSHYNYGQGGVTYYDFKQQQSLKTCKMMFRRN